MNDEPRFPDSLEVVACPDRMSKLEAARWLRLYGPVTRAMMHELAGGPLVEDGPQVNVVDVAGIWARGVGVDADGEPLNRAEREVFTSVCQRMIYKVEYLIRRRRLRPVRVGKEDSLHIDELRRFIRGDGG